MKNFHDWLIGGGNAHKIALTAVMRKLVTLANMLLRETWCMDGECKIEAGIHVAPLSCCLGLQQSLFSWLC